ncbi:permease [Caproiciproducens sp. NJN-50]|uniref:permease n=1 Tax=Caproiciproducens sp. NJN-50 TaxID=2507162 RepID=UPI000FFE0B26|nr:permease [Caproiciproducens sp. NJN-50]QAT50528.1 permease [Caproiciproducens sp. NJN-50]
MTRIEVVCGFLGSGKTTLLQHVLEQDYMGSYRRILILQCEDGAAGFDASRMKNGDVLLDQLESPSKICAELFFKIRSELHPDLILIEYNGTWPMERLLSVRMPKGYRIDRILFCADASTFGSYWKNAGSLMLSQLGNADAVCANRGSGPESPLRSAVGGVNRSAAICTDGPSTEKYLSQVLDPEQVKEAGKWQKIGELEVAVLAAVILFFLTQIPRYPDLYTAVQSVQMIFIGILMQAVPFLLIGAFVSALLQVYVPDESLVRLFAKHPLLGFPLAAVLGVFFPICDCGIVPIASRLAQKGVPLPQAMVFMLAAPAVNPVTILSTLYAFSGQPQYALYRIGLGALIALAAGILLSLFRFRSADVLSSRAAAACSCGADGCAPRHTGRAGRMESVFITAGQEFLSMGRYIIGGSLLCAVLQQTVPASLFLHSGSAAVLPVFLMLLAAFFLSVCSTANAFIGRSFLNLFPAPAVMGFIVMGPMLDLSNLLMLSGSFQKKFVARLAGILLGIAVPVFLLFSLLFKGGSL